MSQKLELCLAPIKGVTDVVFRNCRGKFFPGFDLALTPFIATEKGCPEKPRFLNEVSPKLNTLPTVPQLLSNDADQFLVYADALYNLGYTSINWNLGCPSPMVSNRKRGSGLLPYPGFIDAFLKKVISRFPGKVSVKMRLGRKNESEIFDLLPVLNSYPLSEIIIHPRTGVQMYNGDVNLDTFERVLSLTNHEIVYSGDIWNVEKFQMLANRFSKITRWMLGRGALINPFLAAEIKGLETSPKKGKILKDFHDLLLAEYEKTCCGHLQALGKMKGIWFYLSRLFPENPPLLKKMKRARKIPAYKEAANSFFEWQDKVSL